MSVADFEPWLTRWRLTPEGEGFVTPYTKSRLLRVRYDGAPAILKIAVDAEEIAGAALMDWWDGDGAARVLAREAGAVLLERLPATRSLIEMAKTGADDEAIRVLCDVASRLHASRREPPIGLLPPMEVWLRALPPAAAAHGGILNTAADMAATFLKTRREPAVLHGDLHHGNVLDAGPRGWLIIDPKGLVGDRAYEFVAMLSNPDPQIAEEPGRLARRVATICEASGLEPAQLYCWLLVHSGVSAAWLIEDGFDPAPALRMAELAKAAL